MSKELKYIELVLENCECITFQRNVIGRFILDHIKTIVARMAMNSITEYKVAGTLAVEIFSEGNEDYCPFGFAEDKTTKFGRLSSFNDLSGIEVHYDDGTSDYYLLEYDEEPGLENIIGAPNINEKQYISKPGNLYIVVDKTKDIKDYFEQDEIEGDIEIAYYKRMFGVHDDEESIG
ncbi:MAG: hypothetical protein IJI14_20050 [Anaerolineaceae bacterium]|nr:hypothetical protein [Anaerolineaceae bacterium]